MLTISDNATILEINERSETDCGDFAPRVQRVATLDGGSVITNHGFSHCDRTFRIVAGMSRAEVLALQQMIGAGGLLYLSCVEGYFSGVISRFVPGNGVASITFWVKERLDV